MSPAFPRALRACFSGYLWALPSVLLQKIWKSHPLTRLSGAGRTGVGHRRWAQQRTPALSPQPEPRPPGTPPLAVPAFPNTRRFGQRAMHPHSRPAEGEAFGGNRGARGELFPPHVFPVFSAFSLFLPFLPFTPGRRRGRRGRFCRCRGGRPGFGGRRGRGRPGRGR